MSTRQFEYLRLGRDDLWKKTFLKVKPGPSHEEIQENLNKLGKQGWELVTVEHSVLMGHFYLFKRELV